MHALHCAQPDSKAARSPVNSLPPPRGEMEPERENAVPGCHVDVLTAEMKLLMRARTVPGRLRAGQGAGSKSTAVSIRAEGLALFGTGSRTAPEPPGLGRVRSGSWIVIGLPAWLKEREKSPAK